MMRCLQYCAGCLLLTLFIAKVWAGDVLTSGVLVAIAAAVELMLALIFLCRRYARWAAPIMVALGLSFAVATLVSPPRKGNIIGCGCFGAYKATFLEHMAVAVVVLGLGASMCLLDAHRSARPARGPDELPRSTARAPTGIAVTRRQPEGGF